MEDWMLFFNVRYPSERCKTGESGMCAPTPPGKVFCAEEGLLLVYRYFGLFCQEVQNLGCQQAHSDAMHAAFALEFANVGFEVLFLLAGLAGHFVVKLHFRDGNFSTCATS